jgi:flagellar motor switch/type III secretory pathway protein FliN
MDVQTSPDRQPERARGAGAAPYPWHSLCSVPREAVGMIRDARRAAAASVDLSALGQALGEIVGCQVRLLVSHIDVVTGDAAPAGICLAFGSADGSVEIDLDIDKDLGVTLVGAVIGRRAKLAGPRARVEPEIEGAVAAIVCSVLRRAHGHIESLHLLGPGARRRAPGERLLRLATTVLIDNDAFSARVTVRKNPAAAPPGPPPRDVLASLGDLALSVPVIVASAALDPAEVDALAEGDVFVPGSGWTIARDGGDGAAFSGRVTLAPPMGERGVLSKLGSSGDLVVVGLSASPLDTETTMGDSKADEGAISEAVLQAPVVVRVELGAVTLTAREWAALGPGDVVPVGKRVAEPVVLRVAGLEVAKGDLVEIEGELGVRIRERSGKGET